MTDNQFNVCLGKRQRKNSPEMYAVQKSEAGAHQSPFYEAKSFASLPFTNVKDRKQDANFNILEEAYDKNENWRKDKREGDDREEKRNEERDTMPVEDNRIHQKIISMAQLKVARSEMISLSSPEEEVRSPPEGAEIMQLGGDTPQDKPSGCSNDWASSPLEDNGYASSSLSIDSPDSVTIEAWDDDTTPVPTSSQHEAPEMENSDDESSTDSESLTQTLTEAYQSLQDKEKLKELEKEKHHAQLTMYRRLALLRWIRGLQQRVKDQQNRLQESFDTILDNRKEILRYIQHGYNKSPTKDAT